MATYQTEQKKELLNFLRRHSHRSFTIDEILTEMEKDPKCIFPPGKSTLYRLIPKLIAENHIRQFNNTNGRKTTYQILDGTRCQCHIHFKCTVCGKIFHASDQLTDKLKEIFTSSDGMGGVSDSRSLGANQRTDLIFIFPLRTASSYC